MSWRVLIFGTFDHLHPGHRFVLDEGSKRGDVTVIVARDVTVERIKGRKPKQSEAQRRETIANAYPKATVVLGDPNDYLAPVRAAKPDLILLGYDQRLPPGVTMEDLPCPVERLPAFEPEMWKSSLMESTKSEIRNPKR